MQRRTFLAAALITAIVPSLATADGFMTYTPGLIKSELKAGKTVFVDYSATWCGTCARQARVIDELRAKNPAYDAAMTFIKVDWDDYGSHDVSRSRNVPRRSTLLVLNGNAELGRIVAGTGTSEIKKLLDKGL